MSRGPDRTGKRTPEEGRAEEMRLRDRGQKREGSEEKSSGAHRMPGKENEAEERKGAQVMRGGGGGAAENHMPASRI